MDRILKAPGLAKAKKTEGFRLLLPAESSWELWAGKPGSPAACEEQGELKALAGRLNGSSVVGIPMQYVTIFPLWLTTTDRTLMAEMVWMQLERKGLLSGSREGTVMDYRVVREEAGRCLVSISILSETYPQENCFKGISKYFLSSDFLRLPADRLVLWKELGQQTMVFTAGPEIVYAQSLKSISLDTSVIQEALCARLQLQSEGITTEGFGIVAYGNFHRGELDNLGRALGVSCSLQPRQDPVVPAAPHPLTPFSVRQVREKQKKNARTRGIAYWVAGAYLLMAALILGQLGWLAWDRNKLENDLATHEEEVQTIRTTALRWEAMELSILPETYPIEMLFRCTRRLPEDGVRLVTFDQVGTKVLMTGEAKSSAAAFQFLQDMKKGEDLSGYQWEMPPPKLLPNDSAQFQIEGKRSYATADKQ